MKYKNKTTNKIVEATQWFKDGDHPLDHSIKLPNGNMSEGQVVGFYRKRDDEERICFNCGHTMYEHGMLGEQVVCPGYWVVTEDTDTYVLLGNGFFKKLYFKL